MNERIKELAEQKIVRKKALIARHTQELKEMLNSCSHENTIEQTQYVAGDYYDKAHTMVYRKCLVCESVEYLGIKEHGYYG